MRLLMQGHMIINTGGTEPGIWRRVLDQIIILIFDEIQITGDMDPFVTTM